MEQWVRTIGAEHKMWFTIEHTKRVFFGLRKSRIYFGCERSGAYRYTGIVEEGQRKKTGTKKNLYLFGIIAVEHKDRKWMVEVKADKAQHNHPLGVYDQWYDSSAKLNKEELAKVAQMSSSNMKTKQILQQLKIDNLDNVSTGRQVANALQKIKREKIENLTPIQYFLWLLKDHDYYRYTRKELGTNSLGDVFFAHPTATDQLRLFGYVLVMDTTYKTKRFDLPLFEVVGVAPTGQNFHVAFAFIKNENKDSFVWALEKLKTLFGTPAAPGVIVTDRDQTLMNAV
ncbi:hypothetical protein Dimus_039275 [Dionaea muscipula]